MKLSTSLTLTRQAKVVSAAGSKPLEPITLKFRGQVTAADDKRTIRILTKFPLTDGRDVDTWAVPWAADIVTWKRGRYVVNQAEYYRPTGGCQHFTRATCQLIPTDQTK